MNFLKILVKRYRPYLWATIEVGDYLVLECL